MPGMGMGEFRKARLVSPCPAGRYEYDPPRKAMING